MVCKVEVRVVFERSSPEILPLMSGSASARKLVIRCVVFCDPLKFIRSLWYGVCALRKYAQIFVKLFSDVVGIGSKPRIQIMGHCRT